MLELSNPFYNNNNNFYEWSGSSFEFHTTELRLHPSLGKVSKHRYGSTHTPRPTLSCQDTTLRGTLTWKIQNPQANIREEIPSPCRTSFGKTARDQIRRASCEDFLSWATPLPWWSPSTWYVNIFSNIFSTRISTSTRTLTLTHIWTHAQERPKTAQEEPKRAQGRPKSRQDSPKWDHDNPKEIQRETQESSKISPKKPKTI